MSKIELPFRLTLWPSYVELLVGIGTVRISLYIVQKKLYNFNILYRGICELFLQQISLCTGTCNKHYLEFRIETKKNNKYCREWKRLDEPKLKMKVESPNLRQKQKQKRSAEKAAASVDGGSSKRQCVGMTARQPKSEWVGKTALGLLSTTFGVQEWSDKISRWWTIRI